MILLKNNLNEKIKIDINSRVGSLLSEQRKLKGFSVRTVARKIKIKKSKLAKWEAGDESPPAYLFYKIVCLYGRHVYQAAAELDFQLQLEKYQRSIQQISSLPKQPALICSENFDSIRAA